VLHKVLEIRHLTTTAYALRIERKKISFKAGQCFNLGLKNSGVNREYSIYSGENDAYLEFLVKEIKKGIVSPSLRQVNIGDEINLHGPYGSFVIDPIKIKQVKFYFICTGTGIAPFHSFIRSHPNLDYQIINGIRFLNERYDYDTYHPLKITTCISREKWTGFHGRLTAYLPKIPIDTKSIFYICGNQKMIQEAYVILRKKKVSGNDIFTEAFF
jgi:ferredoxin/flavodoxin---NADP+ reductase